MDMLALPSFMEQTSVLLKLQHENELRVTMLNVESMNTINCGEDVFGEAVNKVDQKYLLHRRSD